MVFVQFVHFFIMIESDRVGHHATISKASCDLNVVPTWRGTESRTVIFLLSFLLCSILLSPCFIRQLLFTTTHHHCVQGLYIWLCIHILWEKLVWEGFIAILLDHPMQMYHLYFLVTDMENSLLLNEQQNLTGLYYNNLVAFSNKTKQLENHSVSLVPLLIELGGISLN